eukprot:gene34753-42863_t
MVDVYADDKQSSVFEDEKNAAAMELRVCLLPGLSDLNTFKDLMSTATYVLEIHKEDLYKRAFHTRNCEEFHKMLLEESGSGPRPAPVEVSAAASAVPAKGAKAPAKAAATAPETAGVFGPMLKSDKFLLQCITRALTTSRQIRPHGTIRFRLEQLLSQSNDLLTQFSRRRNGLTEGDDNITVQEDMLLEVRLEKPSKPEKWDLPADISLRSALDKAKSDTQSRLDGTLAIGGGTTLLRATGKAKTNPPRHELFITSGTNVQMSASLHRKLLVSDANATVPDKKGPKPPIGSPTAKSPTAKSKKGKAVEVVPDDPLSRRLAVTPFTRMVFQFRYLDDDTLLAISNAITKVNSTTLANIQGTIRSYSFTDEELQQSIGGQLDVISGFMIIDDDVRMVVLEGLAAPGKGMESLYIDLPRQKANDETLKILCNPEVLFPTRLYATFGPDLRRIRIRDKLKKLVRRPEIYNRKQVDELCFSSIDAIMALKRATDLKSTKELDLYPSAESLNKLELLYGEAISRADMDGTLKNDFMKHTTTHAVKAARRANAADEGSQSKLEASLAQSVHSLDNSVGTDHTYTDCRNEAFEEHLRTRPLHRVDHLKENRTLRQEAWRSMLLKNANREQEYTATLKRVLGDTQVPTQQARDDESINTDDSESNRRVATEYREPKIYLYSTQSLNYKTKAFGELRAKITEDKGTTYTYSQDFVSQTICAIDEESEAKRSAAESKNHWLTSKGFQYPKPKTRNELIGHKNKPSESRIDELKEPFVDSTDVKASAGDTEDPELRRREKGYTTRMRGTELFGSLNPPEFGREFQLKLVGDRGTLPRGQLLPVATQADPNAFRSVHLIDKEKARLMEESAAKDREDWQSKVVVDHLDFKMSGFKVRDKAIPVDRTSDILKSEPKRLALVKLRNATTAKGRDIGYGTAPLSLMNSEPYVQNATTKALVRGEDNTQFITAKLNITGVGGTPQDFVRYINNDAENAKVLSVLSKKKHPSQDSHERTGPRWEQAAHK